MISKKIFDFFNDREFRLYKGIGKEFCNFYGVKIFFIPKQSSENLDFMFGEDILESFPTKYEVRGYLISNLKFNGEGDNFGMFGLEFRDELEIAVSREDFITNGNIDSSKQIEHIIGDLLYLPWQHEHGMYEITRINLEPSFYHLGKLDLMEIGAKAWVYSHEDVPTTLETASFTNIETTKDHLDDSEDLETEIVQDDVIDDSETDPFG